MPDQIQRYLPLQASRQVDPGWYVRNPTLRMPWCSWCRAPVVERNGVTVCDSCDGVPLMPPARAA